MTLCRYIKSISDWEEINKTIIGSLYIENLERHIPVVEKRYCAHKNGKW